MLETTTIELVTGSSTMLPIIGLILGLIMLVNGKNDKAKRVLAGYFFLYSIGALLGIAYYKFSPSQTMGLLDPVTMLYQILVMPLLAIYALELFSKNWATVFNGVTAYIPVILFVLIYLGCWVVLKENPHLENWEDIAQNIGNPLVWMRFISIAIALFYSGSLITLIHVKITEYTRNVENNYSYIDGLELGWLKWVSYLFLFLSLLFTLVLLVPGIEIIFVYAFLTWVIWIFLFIKGIAQKSLELTEEENTQPKVEKIEESEKNDEATTSESEERRKELKIKVIEMVSDPKVYLNADLSLQHLALIAGSNRSYVSKIINEEFGSNFFDIINKKRVEYAISILKDENYNNYSLSFIAQLSGFKCDRTMYRAFDKFAQQTPSKYRSATEATA